jgi:acetyl-CoA carboxylase biotin carboxyl carrier protein
VSRSHEAIKRVIEAFERSDWSEIDVRVGDLRVHLSASSPAGTAMTSSAIAPAPLTSAAPLVDSDHPAPTATDDSLAASPPPAGARLVVSPSPGIFWRSPEPGLPPFTDVGQRVERSATVCIVEVMKLMNHVKAGVRGEVVAVYGRNGEAVQKGEPLFAIVPEESDP